MKSQNERFAAILQSTLRNITKSGARRLVVPMSAALLFAGCASFDKDSDVDGQELADDDLMEEAMLGGDHDEVSMETPDSDAEGQIEEMQEEVAAYDDGLEFVPEDIQGQGKAVSADEMFRDWEAQNILKGSLSPEEYSKGIGSGASVSIDGCGVAATGCIIGGKLGGKLACGADLIAVMFGQAEFVPVLSAACYTAIIGTAGTCIAAGGLCGGDLIGIASGTVAATPPTRYLAEAGSNYSTDTEKSANCPGNERAKKVTVWKKSTGGQYVSRVQFQCTDGSNISFGVSAASDLASAATCNQDLGKLVSGLRVRHGSWVDAVGGRCQSAGFADINTKSEYPVTNYTVFGGSGGTLETFECPNHQFVRGMKAHYEDLGGSIGKVITYMRLHCR